MRYSTFPATENDKSVFLYVFHYVFLNIAQKNNPKGFSNTKNFKDPVSRGKTKTSHFMENTVEKPSQNVKKVLGREVWRSMGFGILSTEVG